MERFIQRFSDKIIGVLNGLDRLVIRGTLLPISRHNGMRDFLYQNGVLMKDFKAYAGKVTALFRQKLHEVADREKRPFIYLASSRTNKEEVALRVLKEQPVTRGLICMIGCVEPCKSFKVVPDPERKKIRMQCQDRMCLHVYQYLIHPVFGFMNARIQTWFPFSVQLCINGREWLSRQMDRVGLRYRRLDNCFSWVEDFAKAQKMMEQQLKTNWPPALNRIARKLNPIHHRIFHKIPMDYYWSTPETEWASDIVFRSASDLARIYSAIIPHAMTTFSSHDVMKFLGRKLMPNYRGEVISSCKTRPEGVRIKHWAGANSVKAYDKFQIMLRLETTMNDPRVFRILRPVEKDPKKKLAWQKLRQGIADLHRRAEISQACNDRYADALSQIDSSTPMGDLFESISRPTTYNGRRVRALRISDAEDLKLFQAVCDGKFSISGFRNRDLQTLLYNNPPASEKDKKSRSSRISRLIRILRAHHLVKRVSHTYRYVLTIKGTEILSAILSMRKISLEKFKSFTAA